MAEYESIGYFFSERQIRVSNLANSICSALNAFHTKEEGGKEYSFSFPMGQRFKKTGNNHYPYKDYFGEKKIKRFLTNNPRTEQHKQVSAWTSTPIHHLKKPIAKLDIIILGPKQGTGFLQAGQSAESHRTSSKWTNYENMQELPRKTPASPPTHAKGMVEFLFPLGSFLYGDYFLPHVVSLRVNYSTQTYDEKEKKIRQQYRWTDIYYSKQELETIFRRRVKGIHISNQRFRTRFENHFTTKGHSLETPEIILLRGTSPTKKEYGKYMSITNPFFGDEAYVPFQVFGLLRLDQNNPKNWQLLDDLAEHASPVWKYDGRYIR